MHPDSAVVTPAQSNIAQALRDGLSELRLPCTEDAVQKLAQYIELLSKWNRVYNLTAVRDSRQMVDLHVLDSASVVHRLAGVTRLLDVGTGAGLPGIPLAVLRPDVRVTLLDTVAKKTTFVRQAINELKLNNAAVVTDRVEKYRPPELFEVVISRAFSDLKDFVENAGHLLERGGQMFAMKGVFPHDEIARLPPQFRVVDVHTLRVPGVDVQRHLVVIEKS